MKLKVTRNYQITIPADIRKKMDIKLGSVVEATYDEKRGEMIVRKVKEKRKTLKIGKKLTPEEIELMIESGMRKEIL